MRLLKESDFFLKHLFIQICLCKKMKWVGGGRVGEEKCSHSQWFFSPHVKKNKGNVDQKCDGNFFDPVFLYLTKAKTEDNFSLLEKTKKSFSLSFLYFIFWTTLFVLQYSSMLANLLLCRHSWVFPNFQTKPGCL